MSLLFRRRAEERSVGWSDLYGNAGAAFRSGKNATALRLIPVYAAVALIADQFAVLPMTTYKGGPAASVKVETPSFLLKPDARVSVFDWRYQLAVSLKLRGNAYGIVTGSSIKPDGIVWVHPDSVQVDESKATPVYIIGNERYTAWDQGGKILHIREFVQPGTVVGLSPIAQFVATYETAASAMAYGNDWFKNSAIPSGILRAEKTTLKGGQAKEAKDIFMASTRRKEPVVLDQNWTWQQVSISPDEAQFLQTIKATATQIAAIFRVSPEDIGGEAGSSRTYSNRESDQETFNVRTLLPLTTRVEYGLRVLLPAGEFVKFNMDVLNRPDLLTRSRANTENLKNGSITLPEVRHREDRPPLTAKEIEQWQQWYSTLKSESESTSNATSTSVVTD